ncbi:MAG: hypothetical protein M3R13_06140 [Armatimonadota bacterium]|nr:hypothetical protein [Armatimonadota bacterium]
MPVEPEFAPSGANAALLSAFRDEDGTTGGEYVAENPNDLRLRALYVYRVLRKYDLHLLEQTDFRNAEFKDKIIARLKEARQIYPKVIAVVAIGEEQDPDNAFFPIAQAIAYEGLGKRELAAASAKRAMECRYYNDYSFEISVLLAESKPFVNPYYQFYDRLVFGSEFLWEVRQLARRWSDSNDEKRVEITQAHDRPVPTARAVRSYIS